MVHLEHSHENPTILLKEFLSDSLMNVEIEEAMDLGGPRREFLILFMEAIEKSALLAGPDGRKNLALDSVGALFNLTFFNHTFVFTTL